MQIKNNHVWIFDIETIINCFTYTAINKDTEEIVTYVIWKDKNELADLLVHLDSCRGQVGFNNINFDYPVIHSILKNRKILLKYDGDKLARWIYGVAQETIGQEWSQVRNEIIPQLDLFKIHHFDNKAKMTSLKKLEVALQFENVQDMEQKHNEEITLEEQLEELLKYNLNDVKATQQFLKASHDKIELRKGLKRKYNLDCLNYSDSKIGSELMLLLYCDVTNKNVNQIRKCKTSRSEFKFNDFILDYIKFETPEFNELVNFLREIKVKELKESFDKTFPYEGIDYFYGTGGIHASCKEGIYESDEEYIIVDADVASLYPNLAIKNKFFPQHLGEKFCDVYEDEIVNPRLEAKELAKEKSGLPEEERNIYKVLADGFKLAANSCYGNYNNPYSWLYDPYCTLATTLTGQLVLSMLIEMLYKNIDGISLLQANTDGITVKIKRKDKRKYWEICQEWEKLTRLTLEYVTYEKMILKDVNNYIAINIDPKTGQKKVKRKGIFKLHEEMRKDGEWHKAFNLGILPIALSKYFLDNIPVEETVKSHRDIYDFCKTFSVKGHFAGETYQLDEDGNEINHEKMQKTIRYYPSNSNLRFRKRGEPLAPKFDKRLTYNSTEDESKFQEIKTLVDIKLNELIDEDIIKKTTEAKVTISLDLSDYRLFAKYYKYLNYIFNVSRVEYVKGEEFNVSAEKDWRLIDIESETGVTIFNRFEEKSFEEYDINYEFIISEINKTIDTISGKKERLITELKQKQIDEKMKREERNYIQFCINKIPTSRQFEEYKRDWLIEKYGTPKEIKESKKKTEEKEEE